MSIYTDLSRCGLILENAMDEVNVTSLYNLEPYSLGHQDEPLGSLVFFTIVYVLVLISGLVGNFIVLYVILKNKDLKHFTNYFFANLSAADVFVLIFCVPTAIHDIWAKDQWYMGKFFCESLEVFRNDFFIVLVSPRRLQQPVHRELCDEYFVADNNSH